MRQMPWLLLVVVSLTLGAWGGPREEKQKQPAEETVETSATDHTVRDIPQVRAGEDCPNWAWAAAVEAVLRSDGVSEFGQEYWMDKVYGGTVCLGSAGDTERLIKALDGEYVLDDGKHVAIAATYTPGLPANASDILVPVLNDRLQIMLVRGKAMLFTGARWEDVAKIHGDRTVIVKELRLSDLASGKDLVLSPESDDLSQVDGVFRITVAVIQTYN